MIRTKEEPHGQFFKRNRLGNAALPMTSTNGAFLCLALLLSLMTGWGALAEEFKGTVNLPEGVKLEMTKIVAGQLMLNGRNVVLTKDYWLGKYEVTQKQWQAVMENNPSNFPVKAGNTPVEQVSWGDAKEFCDKLNELCKDQLPNGYRFDLPTEAQWEYAARGGKKINKNKPQQYSGNDQILTVGWCYRNSGKRTGLSDYSCSPANITKYGCLPHPVGKKKPNELGLYDMSGNVWEWCRDWYEITFPQDPEFLKGNEYRDEFARTYTRLDYTVSYRNGRPKRIIRGGAWNSRGDYCKVSCRGSQTPESRSNDIGFRVALVIDENAGADSAVNSHATKPHEEKNTNASTQSRPIATNTNANTPKNTAKTVNADDDEEESDIDEDEE